MLWLCDSKLCFSLVGAQQLCLVILLMICRFCWDPKQLLALKRKRIPSLLICYATHVNDQLYHFFLSGWNIDKKPMPFIYSHVTPHLKVIFLNLVGGLGYLFAFIYSGSPLNNCIQVHHLIVVNCTARYLLVVNIFNRRYHHSLKIGS